MQHDADAAHRTTASNKNNEDWRQQHNDDALGLIWLLFWVCAMHLHLLVCIGAFQS